MRFLIYSLFFAFLLQGCSKKSATNNPPVVDLPDTLSTGWTKVKIDGADFSDVYFADNNTGFAAGTNGIYKSGDGGHSWQKIYNRGTGWNIKGTVDGKIFIARGGDSIYCSYDGGISFVVLAPGGAPGPFNNSITDIFFTNKDSGYVVGAQNLYRTTDGGHTWASASTLAGLYLDHLSERMPFFINGATGWIGNRKSIYHTNGSIQNWTRGHLSDTAFSNFYMHPFATSVQTVYALASGGDVWLFKSVDGGNNFAVIKKFPSAPYSSLYFMDDNNGYVSSGKKIYATRDGGTSWVEEVSLGDETAVEMHFTDSHHGWVCCTSGVMLIFNR